MPGITEAPPIAARAASRRTECALARGPVEAWISSCAHKMVKYGGKARHSFVNHDTCAKQLVGQYIFWINMWMRVHYGSYRFEKVGCRLHLRIQSFYLKVKKNFRGSCILSELFIFLVEFVSLLMLGLRTWSDWVIHLYEDVDIAVKQPNQYNSPRFGLWMEIWVLWGWRTRVFRGTKSASM